MDPYYGLYLLHRGPGPDLRHSFELTVTNHKGPKYTHVEGLTRGMLQLSFLATLLLKLDPQGKLHHVRVYRWKFH